MVQFILLMNIQYRQRFHYRTAFEPQVDINLKCEDNKAKVDGSGSGSTRLQQ